jgi:hypothetical protein
MVNNLSLRLTGQKLQPAFATAVHQSIGSAPTSPAAQVQDPVTVVRTVLSAPHLNYS